MSGNRAYLKDDKVDEMIDAAAVETNQEKRLQIYKRPSGSLKSSVRGYLCITNIAW